MPQKISEPNGENCCCSFCHKSRDVVDIMICSPASFKPRVYICDECVAACGEIVIAEREKRKQTEEKPKKSVSRKKKTPPK